MALKEPVMKTIDELNDLVLRDFSPQEREEFISYIKRIIHQHDM